MFLYCFYLKQIFEYQKSVNITVFINSSVLFFYYLIIYNVFYIPYQTSLEKHIPGFFFLSAFWNKKRVKSYSHIELNFYWFFFTDGIINIEYQACSKQSAA